MIFTSNLEFLSKCRDGQQDFETCQLSYAKNILRLHHELGVSLAAENTELIGLGR